MGGRSWCLPSVDMAARMPHLEYQTRTEWEKVRSFFIRYQDRVIYGTDQAIGANRDAASVRSRAHDIWTRDWTYLTSNDTLTAPGVPGTFRGLKLPRGVIDKIYRINAERRFGLLHAR